MIRGCWPIGIAVLLSVGAYAQPPGPRMGRGDFALIRGEFGAANKVVTGAPYSARAVTEFTETLADGNRIQRTTTATTARDSQGRVRTERSVQAIGALSASGAAAPIVSIFDPVAGMSYVLNTTQRTVRQMAIQVPHGTPGAFRGTRARIQAASKTEDLGTQTIQGVTAQGTRVTRTIPAGEEGNARPIEIVTETWYSPDLQVVVMSKSSDPRFGDSVYQLTNITRTEPDPALFTVPSDYTVEARPMRRGPRGPAQ
ncbi:MAG TPA: hypothetical protein VMB25_18950 [Bryobacteraceae bacterium]|nr:hypothetical protein [Bryobacteraceae bacterium]